MWDQVSLAFDDLPRTLGTAEFATVPLGAVSRATGRVLHISMGYEKGDNASSPVLRKVANNAGGYSSNLRCTWWACEENFARPARTTKHHKD